MYININTGIIDIILRVSFVKKIPKKSKHQIIIGLSYLVFVLVSSSIWMRFWIIRTRCNLVFLQVRSHTDILRVTAPSSESRRSSVKCPLFLSSQLSSWLTQNRDTSPSHPQLSHDPKQSNKETLFVTINHLGMHLKYCCCTDVSRMSWSLTWSALELTKDIVREQEPVQRPPADWELRAAAAGSSHPSPAPVTLLPFVTSRDPVLTNRHFSPSPGSELGAPPGWRATWDMRPQT